ncbi:uncharacterized protein B0H18DRAFT_555828 [Fomitopsis serialis]|uniref:uncharacterized protein n=1 Tax=Fomitopsis serialis TaxID=139415 RepID=UPI0020085CEB|nr:uncharacterized protein B0H18DRAFT_555828 [Neoantrodia serialis]KAH9934338.1 hypothetical protein B0H18DRAFT_555828 [Neoantrodia serialis]
MGDASLPGISAMPSYEQLYTSSIPYCPLSVCHVWTAPAVILHSSGSTSFPKPITYTHQVLFQFAVISDGPLVTGRVFAVPALELFHAAGFFIFSWLPTCGYIMGLMKPTRPATAPTHIMAYKCLIALNAEYAYVPALLINAWHGKLEEYPYLQRLKALLYSGRFLNKSIGDSLVANKIKLFTMYGATEAGNISSICRANQDNEWEYFTMNSHCAVELRPFDDGTFKPVIRAEPYMHLPFTNTVIDGGRAYAPGDLLMPHPEVKDYWKILGREDDQIMLATGDTINPVPIESQFYQHQLICGAVMFGRGRSKPGILLEVDSQANVDTCQQAIEESISIINAQSPEYAQLDTKLVIMASHSKPFSYNIKGLPNHPLILHQYQGEIDAAYASTMMSSASVMVPLVSL